MAEDVSTVDEPYFKRSNVMKRSESSTTEGFGLVYLDNINGNVDTIRLIIPNQKTINQNTEAKNAAMDKRFLNISNKVGDEKEQSVAVTHKGKCKSIASDNDFYKARKNMAAEESEEKMMVEAKKHFGKKCFTTSQIRSLSALFLNVETKYDFLVEAYPHVSDPENFGTLEKELANNDIKNRFKKLIEN